MKEIRKWEETPSLIEVWEMKDAVQKEMEGKTWEEQMEIYQQAMVKAAKILNKTIVKLPNGCSIFV
jgi:hypothetical protein